MVPLGAVSPVERPNQIGHPAATHTDSGRISSVARYQSSEIAVDSCGADREILPSWDGNVLKARVALGLRAPTQSAGLAYPPWSAAASRPSVWIRGKNLSRLAGAHGAEFGNFSHS